MEPFLAAGVRHTSSSTLAHFITSQVSLNVKENGIMMMCGHAIAQQPPLSNRICLDVVLRIPQLQVIAMVLDGTASTRGGVKLSICSDFPSSMTWWLLGHNDAMHKAHVIRPPPNNRGPLVSAPAALATVANSACPTDSAPSGLTLSACLSKQLSLPTPLQLPHKQSHASCTSLSTHTHTVGLPLESKPVFRLY
jgi:hypothetical protein